MLIRIFLKHNWLGIFGIIVGIIGLILSFHFYKMSTSPPEPVFLIDPTRTILIDSARISETPLRVIRQADNREINGDVIATRFYFWNNSRNPIKASNILEPLFITLDEPNGEMLDYRILKCSRKVVNPAIERNSTNPKRTLSLSFSILEKEDGLTGQIIYQGNPKAKILISGTIEGAHEIKTSEENINNIYLNNFYVRILFPLLAIFGFIATFAICYIRLDKQEPGFSRTKKLKKCFGVSFVWLLIALIYFADIYEKTKNGREEAAIMALKEVPKNIVP